MLFKIFILLATTWSTIWTQEVEIQSDCIKQISNCTNVYSTKAVDLDVLYDFHTCILTIDTCDETENILYRQKIMQAILNTIRQIIAEEKLTAKYRGNSCQIEWNVWNVLYPLVAFVIHRHVQEFTQNGIS